MNNRNERDGSRDRTAKRRLSAAAAVTDRIRLATTVMLGPLRMNAALIAKQALSIDALAGGGRNYYGWLAKELSGMIASSAAKDGDTVNGLHVGVRIPCASDPRQVNLLAEAAKV